jgi:UDP-N-acetylglucosamine 2-epimerase (non-hydrolysing)
MTTGRILHVVGARPNFMKLAPVYGALGKRQQAQMTVHTGQHYAARMSDVFFAQLGLPEPEVNLEVGSASHAVQTARIMEGLERVLMDSRPSCVVVYGDVNSTVAAVLVAVKMGILVAHVEAGLRSRDRSMPEEINRLVTDALADVLYTPSTDADDNLRAEGVSPDRIVCVGNVMIDTLVRLLPAARAVWDDGWRNRVPGRYGLVTLHRPSNVDDPEVLAPLCAALMEIARDLPLVFPVHPRTRARMDASRLVTGEGIHLMDPIGYLEFLALHQHAAMVITDSGGIQEESTYLGVPCLTVRENTERPVTVSIGTNQLVGRDFPLLVREARAIASGRRKRGAVPPLWDGQAGDRIAADLLARIQ